ncbi:MAG: amino acid adenylation domain-containing protein [Verrucomicrobiales bacterium]|nr:amino acid adenylation domain-containing protein [Verrucomicrobiales bacterium]
MGSLLYHTVQKAAEEVPDHTAFSSNTESVTYSDLDARTNQLANLLISTGIQPGDRVGIFMPRVVESAVAVYGIMKAGAAFVPIDPQSPVDRVESIVNHCGLSHVVTTPSLLRKVVTLAGLSPKGLKHIIGAGGEHDGIALHSWREVALESEKFEKCPSISTHDLAYIMYTSGSTGEPKGIMHTHYSGLSYARLSASTYDIKRSDRIGNHSPLHFDMSTLGYLTGPYAQATTVIVPDAYTKLPASLAQLVAKEKLTIWYSVPLALNQLLSSGVLDSLNYSKLRWVLFGGEPIATKTLRGLMGHWQDTRFSNVYGPAEINQCSFFHFSGSSNCQAWQDNNTVPLGEIWPDSEGLILDSQDRVLTSRATGELVVHSPTMMRGYWRRPDLDTGAFYEGKTIDGRRNRYYRTGDIVRRDDRGQLAFVGRKDRQVKIRGYRVELDEIELALTSHPSVSETGVFKVSGADGDSRIHAACILIEDHEVSDEDLRKFLSLRLPPYALPSKIMQVDAMPRTGSGKVDRIALSNACPQIRSVTDKPTHCRQDGTSKLLNE